MEKIQALLEKNGLSADASDEICEALKSYAASVREAHETEYAKRVEVAKRICVEETEQSKLELARRLQIFCEAKSAQIEQMMARQAQAREGQAIGTLEQVKSLLEGISISDDSGLRQELQTMKEQLDRLRSERDQAVAKANRQTQLAERVLSRNRMLESRSALADNGGGVLGESINERPRQNGPRPVQRIDGGRRGAQPVTTRRTIRESQDRHEATDDRQVNVRGGGTNGVTPSPAQIAATMEDGPPV